MRMIIAAIAFAATVTPSLAQDLTVRESKFSVKETLDRLAVELDKRGMKVASRVDHAAGAKAVGMALPPTEVVMFGNPKLGTPLMLSAPAIGIELPMKMMAWQDKAGKVWIGYVAPNVLKERYRINDRDEQFKTMTGALDALAKAASGQ
jgi:uncharacterized protein (DUF302 family)